MKSKSNLSTILKTISCSVLGVFGILAFIFALVSGSKTYGGGFTGIVKNCPNALPYFLLLALIYFGWRWPLIGGILITLLGFGLLYLFGIFGENWNVFPFVAGMIPIVFGGLLIYSWGLKNKQKPSI